LPQQGPRGSSDLAHRQALRHHVGWVGLTPGEHAVALLAAAGASNQEIAALRGTSSRTVANQLHQVFQKLRIGSRAELSTLVCQPPSEDVAPSA